MPASGSKLRAGQFGPVLHGGRHGTAGRFDLRRVGLAVVAGASVLVLAALAAAGALVVVSQRSIDQIELGNVGDHDDADEPAQAAGEAPAGVDPATDVEYDELTEPTNILVVGTDSRTNLTEEQLLALGTEDEGGSNLTDTIILAQMDPAQDTAALLSFPRDLYVPRCDGSTGKINAAFSIGEAREEGGGPACLVDTIEDYTEIPIDHYVQVDLAGFINAVDAIGGVTFYVDQPLRDVAAGLDIDAGCVHFDGTKALGFVRARGIDSDFGRIARQQRFVVEMVDKVTSAGVLLNPVRLFSLVNQVGQAVTTDSGLGLSTQRDLAFSLRDLSAQGLQARTVPGDIRTIDGASVVVADDDRAEQLFAAFRAGSTPSEAPPASPPQASSPQAANPPAAAQITPSDVGPLEVLNGAGTAGLAAETAAALRSRGFDVERAGNAERFGVIRTRVLYPRGALPEAGVIVQTLEQLGVDARLVRDDAGDGLTIVLGEDVEVEDLTVAEAQPSPTQTAVEDDSSPDVLPSSGLPEYRGAQVSQRAC